MNTVLKFAFLSAVMVHLIGCSANARYENKHFENLFSLDIEETMVDIGNHDPYALTEYGNTLKEFYFKVIHETVDNYQERNNLQKFTEKAVFNHYINTTESRYTAYMASLDWISNLDTVVHKMPCTIHELKTDESGYPIRYKIAYYMSENQLYQLHVWVIEKRINRFNEGMNQMIYSFKEI